MLCVALVTLLTSSLVSFLLSTIKDLFHAKAEEVEQSIRYCRYHLADQEGSAESGDLLEQMKAAGQQQKGQALQDMLNAVLVSSRKEEATKLEHVKWGSQEIPLRSEEVRLVSRYRYHFYCYSFIFCTL